MRIFKNLANPYLNKEIDIPVGMPIGKENFADAEKYFNNIYVNQDIFAISLIKRLNLFNKEIVSIESGYSAEEILFSKFGNNHVTCIEPDPFSRKISQHFINKESIGRIYMSSSTMHKVDPKIWTIH